MLDFLHESGANFFFFFSFLIHAFASSIAVCRNELLWKDAPTNMEVKVTFAENGIELPFMSWQLIWENFSFLNQETSFNF